MTGPPMYQPPQQGQPQAGQGQGFGGQGAGLPQGQPGYVPPQQRFDGAPPQQPQYQYPQGIPPMAAMPSSDQVTLPPPYFPPPQQPPQGPPPQGWPPQQQPQGGWPQPYVAGQPQGQPPQQGGYAGQLYPQFQQPGQPQAQPQQRPQAPSGVIQQDAYGRLYGPGLPPHLQGATADQVRQAYGMVSQGQPQQQPQYRQLPQPQGQQPPQQQPPQPPPSQGQVPAQAQPRSFWADPEGAIERIVEQRMAPITQATLTQAIQGARDTVAGQYPEFAQYEQDVIQRMQGLAPELLSNPQAWRLAFEQAVGERYLAQQRGQFRQQPQQQNGSLPPQNGGQPGWSPYPQQRGPALGDFFTESPSQGYQSGGDQYQPPVQLTPQQREAARRFGLTEQAYASGMGVRY
jgi:hypothetical protein